MFSWPLVVEALMTTPLGWLVYDSSSKPVGVCGKLANDRWYFETAWTQDLDPSGLGAGAWFVRVVNVVVKLFNSQNLQVLVVGFQRYVSALCAVSVSQVCELAASSLIVLKLKLRSLNSVMLPKLFSALECFVGKHEAELV